MSVEEEVELRDLIAQTLELNGCLPKIRAQLRAELYLALDEDSKISKQQSDTTNKLKPYLEVPEGQLMLCLVREFLEYFDLDFTVSVYEPESCEGSCYKYEGRQKIIEDLGLKNHDETCSGPILLHLIKIAQTKSNVLKINLTNINGTQTEEKRDSSGSSVESPIHDEINGDCEEAECLNATFAVKPLVNDDTFNGTSSIEEETVNSTDHSSDTNEKVVGEEEEFKLKSDDKRKGRVKGEVSPMQLNKPRGNDILPSLYSCKDKSSKDLDFDIKDDYEEDFMSGSEIDFSVAKTEGSEPLDNELPQSPSGSSISNSINKSNTSGSKSESHGPFTNSKTTSDQTSALQS